MHFPRDSAETGTSAEFQTFRTEGMLTNVDLLDLEIKTQFGLKMKVGGDFSQFCISRHPTSRVLSASPIKSAGLF